MDKIVEFVITLVSMLILMTAIELIAPDNSMKKYLKFVLGLILTSVILTPIISILTNGEQDILDSISKYKNEYNEVIKIKDNNDELSKQEEVFKKNLEKSCTSLLGREFRDKEFNINVDCSINEENLSYTINNISIGIVDKKIEEIQKVQIGTEAEDISIKADEKIDEELVRIKKYLSENLGIHEDDIEIYRLK